MAGRTLAGRRNLDNERALRSEGSQLDPELIHGTDAGNRLHSPAMASYDSKSLQAPFPANILDAECAVPLRSRRFIWNNASTSWNTRRQVNLPILST
jgi:hypothetical protein